MNYRERMKEYLKEPGEYSSDWGRWGILNKEQRTLIRRLLDEMDRADEVIKHQYFEIERLKAREQECLEHYTTMSKYASEIEGKYVVANNIINELEKWLVEWREMLDCPDFYEEGIIDCINDILTKLQELKGSDK